MERFSLDLPRTVKKGCSLEMGLGVCEICGRRGNIFGLCNLKLGQAIRCLACGDQ